MLFEYRQATLLRISLADSIGFSASTAVPIWVGSVGAHFGFPSWGAGAGVALEPGIAGLVSRGVDFVTLGYAALACVVAAMTLFLCAQRLLLTFD
jgi:hypothetical protein